MYVGRSLLFSQSVPGHTLHITTTYCNFLGLTGMSGLMSHLTHYRSLDIFEIFSPSGSQAILVFSIPNRVAMFWRKLGTPLTGVSNARGLWENDDFRPISCSIWEMVIVRWAHSARQSVSGTVSTDCLSVLSGVSTIHCDVYLTSHGFMSVSGPRAPGILPMIMSWTGASMHYTFAIPV